MSAESATFKRGVNISHWLAQHAPGKYATPDRFSAADAAWIADHGFDHVRIPVDGRILMSVEGTLIEELLEPFDQALTWCADHNLGVLLDMHYLPGNEFLNDAEDNALWSDPGLHDAAAAAFLVEHYGASELTLDPALLEEHYRPVIEWAQTHDVEVVITEFGTYVAADPDSTAAWTRANVELCETAGFGWTVWDYKGGFAVRGPAGEPTAVYRGLFPTE